MGTTRKLVPSVRHNNPHTNSVPGYCRRHKYKYPNLWKETFLND
jgi:hypothetical protein